MTYNIPSGVGVDERYDLGRIRRVLTEERPDIAARNSNHVYYANGNLGSQPLLDAEIIGDPAIYPDAATMARLFTLPPRDAKLQRLINRLWADVKAGTSP